MGQLRFPAFKSVAFGSITGSYTNLGTPFAQPLKIFAIQNNTDGVMSISVDGVTDQIPVVPYSARIVDISANAEPVHDNDGLNLPVSTQFSIRYLTAPTVGSVYVDGAYNFGGT